MAGSDVARAIHALKLFNEKADKLEALSFTRTLREQPDVWAVSLSIHEGDTMPRAQWQGPDAEAVDAFVLTFRFFVSDNEPSSLRMMAQTYKNLGLASLIPIAIVDEFNMARDDFNNQLDNSPSSLVIDDLPVRQRDVYEIVLWGGLAHASPKKRQIYNQWAENPLFLKLAHIDFAIIVSQLMDGIYAIRETNRKVLAILETTSDTRQ